MEWKELPGNYDDFQAEIYHVKDTVTVLKSFLDEYIQHEVRFEVLTKALKIVKGPVQKRPDPPLYETFKSF